MNEPDLRLLLPIPLPEESSPNWHGHWAEKYRAENDFREYAEIYLGTREVPGIDRDGPALFPNRARVQITVHLGRGRRKRDDDNVTAQCKPLLDVLTKLNVWRDDRYVDLEIPKQDRQTKEGNLHYPGGSVTIEIWDATDRGEPVNE